MRPAPTPVADLVEKPSEDTARGYLRSGNYSWNAGMFVAPVALMLERLLANEPELHAGLMEIAEAWDTENRREVVLRVSPTLPKIAIDYAVAEPAAAAGDVAMIPGIFSWDDVGDFAAIGRLNPPAENSELTVMGDQRPRLYSRGRFAGDRGARCRTRDRPDRDRRCGDCGRWDALLVTTKDHAQEVKKAVEHLKASENETFSKPGRRPWGRVPARARASFIGILEDQGSIQDKAVSQATVQWLGAHVSGQWEVLKPFRVPGRPAQVG